MGPGLGGGEQLQITGCLCPDVGPGVDEEISERGDGVLLDEHAPVEGRGGELR